MRHSHTHTVVLFDTWKHSCWLFVISVFPFSVRLHGDPSNDYCKRREKVSEKLSFDCYPPHLVVRNGPVCASRTQRARATLEYVQLQREIPAFLLFQVTQYFCEKVTKRLVINEIYVSFIWQNLYVPHTLPVQRGGEKQIETRIMIIITAASAISETDSQLNWKIGLLHCCLALTKSSQLNAPLYISQRLTQLHTPHYSSTN